MRAQCRHARRSESAVRVTIHSVHFKEQQHALTSDVLSLGYGAVPRMHYREVTDQCNSPTSTTFCRLGRRRRARRGINSDTLQDACRNRSTLEIGCPSPPSARDLDLTARRGGQLRCPRADRSVCVAHRLRSPSEPRRIDILKERPSEVIAVFASSRPIPIGFWARRCCGR